MRTPVHRDDAAVAVLLVKNRHVSGTLHDPVVAAVGTLPHHSRHAVGQAAFAGIRVQVRLERTDSVAGRRARLGLPARPAYRESVRRVDRQSATSACTPFVAVRGPARSCCTRSRESAIRKPSGGPPRRLRRRPAVSRPVPFGLLPLRDFFVGQGLASLELCRPLQRNRRFVSPHALEIRIAPRRARGVRTQPTCSPPGLPGPHASSATMTPTAASDARDAAITMSHRITSVYLFTCRSRDR